MKSGVVFSYITVTNAQYAEPLLAKKVFSRIIRYLGREAVPMLSQIGSRYVTHVTTSRVPLVDLVQRTVQNVVGPTRSFIGL